MDGLHDGCMLVSQWGVMAIFCTRFLSWKSAGKHQQDAQQLLSYMMHNPKQERYYSTALQRGEMQAVCSWGVEDQFCEA